MKKYNSEKPNVVIMFFVECRRPGNVPEKWIRCSSYFSSRQEALRTASIMGSKYIPVINRVRQKGFYVVDGNIL